MNANIDLIFKIFQVAIRFMFSELQPNKSYPWKINESIVDDENTMGGAGPLDLGWSCLHIFDLFYSIHQQNIEKFRNLKNVYKVLKK